MKHLIVIAGPNGSGKTTITQSVLSGHKLERDDLVIINPDDIAINEFGSWDKDSFIKAANLAEERRFAAISQGEGLLFETVYSTKGKVDFIQHAKEQGYFVSLHFICTTSPAINAMRVAERILQGGHPVPIEKILERYGRSIAMLKHSLTLPDLVQIYDNSGEKPEVVALIKNGKLDGFFGAYPGWVSFALSGLELTDLDTSLQALWTRYKSDKN